MTNVLVELRARQAMNARKICFIHVPKCGGDSVSRALARSYSFWDRLIVPNWYVNLHASRTAAAVLECGMMDLREAVLTYKLAEAKTKFVTGHIVCRPRTREAFDAQWQFVTVLRDPVKRWISEFVYNTYGKQDWARNTLPIEAYVDSAVGVASGRRYLEYFSDWHEDEPVAEGHVQTAANNLARFAAVGFLEDLPAFALTLQQLLGRPVRIPRVNVSPSRERTAEIMRRTDLMGRIRTLCSGDIAVCELVRAGMKQTIATPSASGSAEVAAIAK
jgi:hypothetical protein